MMDIVCPCCRAINSSSSNCRRCKADLSLLFQLEATREEWLFRARQDLAQDRIREALESIDRAESLRSGTDLAQLRAVAHLLLLDYHSALEWYERAQAS